MSPDDDRTIFEAGGQKVHESDVRAFGRVLGWVVKIGPLIAALGIGTGVGGGIDWFGNAALREIITRQDAHLVEVKASMRTCWERFGEYREEHP